MRRTARRQFDGGCAAYLREPFKANLLIGALPLRTIPFRPSRAENRGCRKQHRELAAVTPRQIEGYRRIVDRFEEIARAHVDRSVAISELCRMCGVEQRALLRAFRAVRGTNPSGFLRAPRLARARQVLLSADAETESVTQVAMRFGFREPGRFAVEYRAKFGESPSETLRRTSPN